jgi:hypothetical protein
MPGVTRLEIREGFWHLVSYEVAGDGTATELGSVPTPWGADMDPKLIAVTDETPPDPSAVSEWPQAALRDDSPIIFASKLRLNDGTNTQAKSELDYPDPPPWRPSGTAGQQELGKDTHTIQLGPGDPRGSHKTGCGFVFEIVFPKSSAPNCDNHVKQYCKMTHANTYDDPKHGPVTLKTEFPAGDPSTKPPTPGGFDASGWGPETEDKNLKTGKNAADQQTGGKGSDSGYLDDPATIPLQPGYHNPSALDGKFRVELIDCHNQVVEWLEFEVHIAIDANGNVTRAEVTDKKSGP